MDRVAELCADLDPEQRAAVDAPPGPLCILAGAGTGKTRTITRRIAVGEATGAMPGRATLALTFTARAAGELRARLAALEVPGAVAATFHAAARRQLAYFWPRQTATALPELVSSKARLVAEAAGRCGLATAPSAVRDLAAEVEWATASLIGPDAYPAAVAREGRQPPLPAEQVAAVLVAYQQVKQRRGVLDFDDLLLVLAGLIEEHPAVADAVHQRYRCFVVDEYQDLTPLQERLLRLWIGPRDVLTVVGDPDQTIYSFAGATSAPLRRFGQDWPRARVLRLVRDYRSTPQVVAVANQVMGRRGGAGLVAVAAAGPPAQVLAAADDTAEATAVAAAIGELARSGTSLRDIAVLYRINAQSEEVEQALAAAGIGYQVRGGERFFDRPEVREALAALRSAAAGGGAERGVAQVSDVLSGLGFDPAQPPVGRAQRERWESLAALHRLAGEPGGPATLRGYVELLGERAQAQHAPALERVTLSSLHAAKGLEWEAVFLVGLAEGLLPLVHATTAAALAEERRLLYVGVTRARRHLTLSWARARGAGGRAGRRPCRFLADLLDPPRDRDRAAAGSLPPTAGGQAGERRPGVPRRCRRCRRPLGSATERRLGRCADCPSAVDEELFARLRGWRSQTAAALAQPAFCVFTDATLSAIAETCPQSRSELARLPGVGAVKLDRYAVAVLELCRGRGVPAEETPSRPGG